MTLSTLPALEVTKGEGVTSHTLFSSTVCPGFIYRPFLLPARPDPSSFFLLVHTTGLSVTVHDPAELSRFLIDGPLFLWKR